MSCLLIIASYTYAAEIYFAQGQANKALHALEKGLSLAKDNIPTNSYNAWGIINTLFVQFGNASKASPNANQLVDVFSANNAALTALGTGLINHLGVLSTSTHSPVMLDAWQNAWLEATNDLEAFSVARRIFTVGIKYLQSPGNDQTILLDLVESERTILEQAFAL